MIAIIKGVGYNIASIQYALQRLGVDSQVTADPQQIADASHVILPGVGHAKIVMSFLMAHGLDNIIRNLTQPCLGICLGMQLLYEFSAEGQTPCLGIIPGEVTRLTAEKAQRIPHMGWNRFCDVAINSPLTDTIHPDDYVYFVHSYAAPISQYSIAVSEYTQKFTAIVNYKNFYGMQFHPERSGKVGEQLLINFLNLR